MESNQSDNKGVSLQEAISALETSYAKKDAEVKAAQAELTKAQAAVSQAEHDALVTLQQLIPLQNRYLVGIIESQQKKLNAVADVSPAAEATSGSADRQD